MKAFREGRLGRWTFDLEGVDEMAAGLSGDVEQGLEMGREEGLVEDHERDSGNGDRERLFRIVSGIAGNDFSIPSSQRIIRSTNQLSPTSTQPLSSEPSSAESALSLTSDCDPDSEPQPENEIEIATETDTEISYQPPNPSSPLDALVSAALRIHLTTSQINQTNTEKGLNLSNAQQKKLDTGAKLDERRSKWVQKGIVVSGTGGGKRIGGRMGKATRYGDQRVGRGKRGS